MKEEPEPHTAFDRARIHRALIINGTLELRYYRGRAVVGMAVDVE